MTLRYAPGTIEIFIGGKRLDVGRVEVTAFGTEQLEPSGITVTKQEATFEMSATLDMSWKELLASIGPIALDPPESVLEVGGLPVGRVRTGTMELEGNELSMDVVPLTTEFLATTDRLCPEALRNWLYWSGFRQPAELAKIESNPMFGQVLASNEALARGWQEAKEPMPTVADLRAALERGKPARIARALHWRQVRAAAEHHGPTPEQRRKAKRQAQRAARRRQR